MKDYINFVRIYLNFFQRYRKRYRNYLVVIKHVLRGMYPVTASLKNGETIVFRTYEEVYAHLMDLDYGVDNTICVDGLKFYGAMTGGDIASIFVSKQYASLPVLEKAVIDVGAGIGDSSIYFVKRGAKSVIAIEPNEVSYRSAKKNIIANNCLDTIELINAGISSRDDTKDPVLIRLADVVDRYCHNSEHRILKMDCEGCEYDAILNSCYETLAHFSYIQIEYHHGYRNLKLKLEEFGFRVHVTGPLFLIPFNITTPARCYYSHDRINRGRKVFVGMIFAERTSAK